LTATENCQTIRARRCGTRLQICGEIVRITDVSRVPLYRDRADETILRIIWNRYTALFVYEARPECSVHDEILKIICTPRMYHVPICARDSSERISEFTRYLVPTFGNTYRGPNTDATHTHTTRTHTHLCTVRSRACTYHRRTRIITHIH